VDPRDKASTKVRMGASAGDSPGFGIFDIGPGIYPEFAGDTVDGSEIRRSPVEVGS